MGRAVGEGVDPGTGVGLGVGIGVGIGVGLAVGVEKGTGVGEISIPEPEFRLLLPPRELFWLHPCAKNRKKIPILNFVNSLPI